MQCAQLTSCLKSVSSRVDEVALGVVPHFSSGRRRGRRPAGPGGRARAVRRDRRRRNARGGWRERLRVRERQLGRLVLASPLERLEPRVLLFPCLYLYGGRGRRGSATRVDVRLKRRRPRVPRFPYTHGQHGGGGGGEEREEEEQLLVAFLLQQLILRYVNGSSADWLGTSGSLLSRVQLETNSSLARQPLADQRRTVVNLLSLIHRVSSPLALASDYTALWTITPTTRTGHFR